MNRQNTEQDKITTLNRILTDYEIEYISKGFNNDNSMFKFAYCFVFLSYIFLLGLMVFMFLKTRHVLKPIILSLVFSILFVPFLIYIKKRISRKPEPVPPVSFEGTYREITSKTVDLVETKYYIGPFAVIVPNHWIELGYLKNEDHCTCEGFPIPVIGYDQAYYSSNYIYMILTLDSKYSIDKEYQHNLSFPKTIFKNLIYWRRNKKIL